MGQRAWQEADLKGGVQAGGSIVGVFIICRTDERGRGFIPYIRASWGREFKPLRTYRERSDRVFRSLDKLVELVREDLKYQGEISLFVAGDRGLRRFKALLPTDQPKVSAADGQHVGRNGEARLHTAPEGE